MFFDLIIYLKINFYYVFSFLISYVLLTFFYNYIAIKFKILDYPNNRKIHFGNIPLTGGLVIYSSLLFYLFVFDLDYWLFIIFYSSSIVLFFGFLDDRFQIGVVPRLISQLIACIIIIGSGIHVVTLGDYFDNYINLGIYGMFFTIICVIGFTNAINFIDGIDGLSSSVSIIAIFSILFYSYHESNLGNHVLLFYLLISLFIFLLSNLNIILPKSFLGDSGSMFLGFFIAWLLIYFSHPDINYFHPVLCIWVASLPIFDLMSVFLRRVYKKTNPFKPDRRHIHHLLMLYGFSNKYVLIIASLFSIFNSMFGYAVFKFYGSFACLFIFFIFSIIYLLSSILFGRNLKNNP